ncbi:PstS family phosphate ABC transporter substrate-binding protein [Halococcus saccharolyticus]|uniref:Phosphate ABC transporter substrate-binding protein, phot family n=1 Tax=Halococcus saccharolyticus DSM 5350 TaxID=1227455 RepID=M0MEG1_9EURY|nr:phosphate ABC transporter substrate-binding protein, phot family [Halococcus saccharolyticus DSM 5350]
MGIGTGTAIGVAGCTGGSGNGSGGDNDSGSNASGGGNDSSANASGGGGSTSGGQGTSGGSAQQSSGALTADGSSTVYPITSDGASVWNSNPPADDGEYWGSNDEGTAPGYEALGSPDMPMAEFFASIYGLDPYQVNVGLSHSGTGIEKLMNDQVDIGDSSAPVQDELPERESYDDFVDHVVGVDGQPVIVSQAIADAGVTKLTGEQLRGIYTGEITNWSEIDSYSGDDKEIQNICRAEGSGTDTAFRANFLGDPNAEIACSQRIGQNQQVRSTVLNSDNAIAYIALAFTGNGAPAIALELDGTTYELGKNLGSKDYPLSRDLHCYTWQDTSPKESAFINMLLTEFGQTQFVEANDYFKLPPNRREEERSKLAEPEKDIEYSGGNASSGNASSGNASSGNTSS